MKKKNIISVALYVKASLRKIHESIWLEGESSSWSGQGINCRWTGSSDSVWEMNKEEEHDEL
jgi:hypothetical protein